MIEQETLLERDVREQTRNRYWDQATYVNLKDPSTPHHYESKDASGQPIWKDWSVAEKTRLLRYAAYHRGRNFVEYGGNKQDMRNLQQAAREVPLTQGKVVSIKVRL